MTSAGTSEIGKFIAHDTLRDAQKEMVIDGINALNAQGFLLAAAPTGIGKTAASLASTIEIARNNQQLVNKSDWIFLSVTPDVGEKIIKNLKFKTKQIIISFISTITLPKLKKFIKVKKCLSK